MIHVQRVSKSFGPIQAVKDVTFEVHAGQCVGLLGPNGAGKSTLLRVITGYFPPTSGEVRVGGHDTVASSIAARRLIGYLPESTPLYGEMRVTDFLSYRASLYGMGRRSRRRAIPSAIELCRLTEVCRRRIGQLSKGYRQRVGLAGALVHNPPVLILDEPTSGLDPSQIRETRSLIRDLAAERTVVVSSHILPEIERTCDRVIIMARGTVRADGPPGELVRKCGHSGAHVVEARAGDEDTGRLADALRAIRGVAGVSVARAEGGPGWARFVVASDAGTADLREPIGREIKLLGLQARELTRAGATLEQVFIRIIDGDSDEAARVPEAVDGGGGST